MPVSPNLPPLYVLCGLVGNASRPRPVPAPELGEAQLRAVSHRYVHAELDPRGELLDALTGEDFLCTREDGRWIDRPSFLAQSRQCALPARVGPDDVRVRLFGRVALVHALYSRVDPHAGTAWYRCTDVHVWSGTHWRLVSAQDTRLEHSGVPAQLQTGPVPAHAPWAGQDPCGDPDHVLRTLNEQYVGAYRAADVAWYAAHLAPDYLAVQGDGAFHDRAAALSRFAKPSFELHFASFPVGRVKVRRFDDVALIHAENAYEMKDGRRGVSRYTDIWHLGDDRWRCICAHITEHQTPTR